MNCYENMNLRMLEICGHLKCKFEELDLAATLLGGQSFRWTVRNEEKPVYIGVVERCLWELHQSADLLKFRAWTTNNNLDSEHCTSLLRKYFRLDVNLEEHYMRWTLAHNHFQGAVKTFRAIRVLDQDPCENLISFICSQNNNIKRISTMVEWLCRNYGEKICEYQKKEYYSFPVLEKLNSPMLESKLRAAKFGYRAKFIANAVQCVQDKGGLPWLNGLRSVSYEKAKEELLEIPGVGPKVADCVCLMSLNHLEAVPVDTHIYKLAKAYYLPNLKEKATTRKTYEQVAETFRKIYGEYAGWAQAVLFCSDLKTLKEHHRNEHC